MLGKAKKMIFSNNLIGSHNLAVISILKSDPTIFLHSSFPPIHESTAPNMYHLDGMESNNLKKYWEKQIFFFSDNPIGSRNLAVISIHLEIRPHYFCA